LKHGQIYAISIGAIFISDQNQKIPYDGPDIDIDWVKSIEMDSPAM
jgi:hypothetical protein